MWRSPSTTTLYQLFEPFHFFTAGDQLVVPISVTHISLPLHQIQSREREIKKRSNEQTLGVNSSAEGELCNIVHVQTNASVDSCKTSTKLLECQLILTRSSFTGLDPLSCRLVSLLSRVNCLCPSSLANSFELLFPTLFSRPLPLPVTARFQVQNPLSGFAPKQTKESSAWRTTYIVLHSECLLRPLMVSSIHFPVSQH